MTMGECSARQYTTTLHRGVVTHHTLSVGPSEVRGSVWTGMCILSAEWSAPNFSEGKGHKGNMLSLITGLTDTRGICYH